VDCAVQRQDSRCPIQTHLQYWTRPRPLFSYIVLEIQAVTNDVWEDISKHLNIPMTKNALHNFVQQNRRNIKSVLGISDVIQNKELIIDHVDAQTKSSIDCGKVIHTFLNILLDYSNFNN